MRTVEYRDGKRHGMSKLFFASGSMASECSYTDGRPLSGVSFWRSGAVRRQILDAAQKWFDKQGRLTRSIQYDEQGRKCGVELLITYASDQTVAEDDETAGEVQFLWKVDEKTGKSVCFEADGKTLRFKK